MTTQENQDISPDRDGTIIKTTIVKGDLFNYPSEFSPVIVHAIGEYNGRIFYDRELDFILGESSEHQLPEGVDRSLRRVEKLEKCRVVLKGSKFTYGRNPPPEFDLPPNAEITFTLFLKDYEKVRASWELLDEEKLIAAKDFKERGTMFLQQGKLKLALQKYHAAMRMVDCSSLPADTEMNTKFVDMLIANWLNAALIYLKMDEPIECIKYCDSVLEKQPENIKAIFRKAQAYEKRKDHENAICHYKKVLELEPNNKAAQKQLDVCRDLVAKEREKERKRYINMFNKMAKSGTDDGDKMTED